MHDVEKYPNRDNLHDEIKLNRLVTDPIYDSIINAAKALIQSVNRERKWLKDFDAEVFTWDIERIIKTVNAGKERQEKYKNFTLQEFLDLQRAERSACFAQLRANDYYHNAMASGVDESQAKRLLHVDSI